MSEDRAELSYEKLKSVLECMLFVSPQPLSAKHAAQALDTEELVVDKAMHELQLDFAMRGLQIVRIAGGFQMCTKPEYAEYISLLLKPERTRLSRAALETVAIVAYRQPITQPEVEAIRGVNSDGVLKTLSERGLLKQAGRRDGPGRPILYATTEEFLNYFGLDALSQLPELEDVQLPEGTPESEDARIPEDAVEEAQADAPAEVHDEEDTNVEETS